tara:strand:- start:71 stop:1789 length:1719 start_codon:yes stop_codon:yes gene_type:complete
MQRPNSLVDILRWRAIYEPNRLAYRFLKDGEYDEVCVTYKELDQRASSIGSLLQTSTNKGDRILLLYPPGLDFIAAYFGALYAGVIAVPVYPPHPARMEKTLAVTFRIVADAKPSAVLLNSSLLDSINVQPKIKCKFQNLKLLVTDDIEINYWHGKWQQPALIRDDIAFLQYTSGSTSTPKGVMVSHGNLLNNLGVIEEAMGLSNKSQTVFWLPPYHDMGLIGGILQALYTGYQVTLMPHLMFLQKPVRWLNAITRFQATNSGAPNFAYDLCVRSVKPEQREQLDLSSWGVAFNGAEPIHNKTMDQFADYFALCGFRKDAFFPCYGLAESTLLASGGLKSRFPLTKNIVKSELQKNNVVFAQKSNLDTRTMVSSGQNINKQEIRIVDPETLNQCTPDQIGEVWLSGPSVAQGYWNKPLETKSTFDAYLSNPTEGPYLRTGDLGFMSEGELYITGRLKNLVIIDGKNHYPHDIERTVEKSHNDIYPAGCAVFSIENADREGVIVMAEIQRNHIGTSSEIITEIRKSVAEHHALSLHDIKLIIPGSIPKTTSGKIKHFICKKDYTSGTLKEITL